MKQRKLSNINLVEDLNKRIINPRLITLQKGDNISKIDFFDGDVLDACSIKYALSDIQSNVDLSEYVTTDVYETRIAELSKQITDNKLYAGTGIEIANNRINCTLDTSLYKIVSELPQIGDENKIYIVRPSDETYGDNKYTEYVYSSESGWETLGVPDVITYDRDEYDNKIIQIGNVVSGSVPAGAYSRLSQSSVTNFLQIYGAWGHSISLENGQGIVHRVNGEIPEDAASFVYTTDGGMCNIESIRNTFDEYLPLVGCTLNSPLLLQSGGNTLSIHPQSGVIIRISDNNILCGFNGGGTLYGTGAYLRAVPMGDPYMRITPPEGLVSTIDNKEYKLNDILPVYRVLNVVEGHTGGVIASDAFRVASVDGGSRTFEIGTLDGFRHMYAYIPPTSTNKSKCTISIGEDLTYHAAPIYIDANDGFSDGKISLTSGSFVISSNGINIDGTSSVYETHIGVNSFEKINITSGDNVKLKLDYVFRVTGESGEDLLHINPAYFAISNGSMKMTANGGGILYGTTDESAEYLRVQDSNIRLGDRTTDVLTYASSETKLFIPQDTFEDTDAVNKKYVDSTFNKFGASGMVFLTQDEYDALETKEEGVVYFIQETDIAEEIG